MKVPGGPAARDLWPVSGQWPPAHIPAVPTSSAPLSPCFNHNDFHVYSVPSVIALEGGSLRARPSVEGETLQ